MLITRVIRSIMAFPMVSKTFKLIEISVVSAVWSMYVWNYHSYEVVYHIFSLPVTKFHPFVLKVIVLALYIQLICYI